MLVSGHNISMPDSQDEIPFLEFDVKGKKISGFTGCNRIFGPLDVKSFIKGIPHFEQLGMTRMLCHDNGLERAFMDGLSKATVVQMQGENMILKDKQGTILLSFKKK